MVMRNLNRDSLPIILIGPMKAGKTTVGRLLAEQLGCPFCSLDVYENRYAREVGFRERLAEQIQAEQGVYAWYEYRRKYFDHVVIRFLQDQRTGVLELGGGHPILPTPEQQLRVNRALAMIDHVFLLIPDPDLNRSRYICWERQRPERRDPDLNELLLSDRRFFELAKHVIYTHGNSPNESCEEILAILGF
jgi:shikimate kinase